MRKGISFPLLYYSIICCGVFQKTLAQRYFLLFNCTIQSYTVGCFKKLLRKGISFPLLYYSIICCGVFQKLLRKGISFPLLYYSIICCVCKCVALEWVSIFNLPLKPLCKRSLRLLTFCPKIGRMWFIDNFLENFYI